MERLIFGQPNWVGGGETWNAKESEPTNAHTRSQSAKPEVGMRAR